MKLINSQWPRRGIEAEKKKKHTHTHTHTHIKHSEVGQDAEHLCSIIGPHNLCVYILLVICLVVLPPVRNHRDEQQATVKSTDTR